MLTRLLFWLVLYPISLLPLSVLYGLSGIFRFLLAYVIQYRAEVIDRNLRLSFPGKNERERMEIRKKYYKHLSELAVEMIKMLTISRKMLKKRYYCSNPELVNRYFQEGKSVILMSSHYNNWEWMVLSLDSQFAHHGVGVGAPNSNKIFEKLINRARTRYGTEVIFADRIRSEFDRREKEHYLTSYMMLSDQSPAHPDKCYKTFFLNQPSGILFGSEHYAKKYNIPVIYYQVIKDKRGYYHIETELITDNPGKCAHGEITDRYIRLLENTIRKQPEYWLWSHRRWKHPVRMESEPD